MNKIRKLVYKIIEQREYIDLAFKARQNMLPLVNDLNKLENELDILVKQNKDRVKEDLDSLIYDMEQGFSNHYDMEIYQTLYNSYKKLG